MKSTMMKNAGFCLAVLTTLSLGAPALADAEGAMPSAASGLSDQVVRHAPRTETSRLLERQRSADAPEESEVPASVYVDSQRRLTETFRRPVPEMLREETTRR